MRLFKKNKLAKISVFSLSFLFGFSTILTSCQTLTETSKNFSTEPASQIIGETELTSLPNTAGTSPKYDLDDGDKNGTWNLSVTSPSSYASYFSFNANDRKISWTGLPIENYVLKLSWTASGSSTPNAEKVITLKVNSNSGGSTPTPSGTELTSSGNIPWDGFYKRTTIPEANEYNYCPNFLLPSSIFNGTSLPILDNFRINNFMQTNTFLLLTTNPSLMKFTDNGNEYYHKRIFIGKDPNYDYLDNYADTTNIRTIEFEINPTLDSQDFSTWYNIYLTKDSGYTRTYILEKGMWKSNYVDTDTGLLTINNFFQDYDVVRDITTTGVCKGSPFDSNNPVPSNNLFSFIRPIAEESAYTSKLFVNGVEVTSDSDYKISNFKFGIKKSSIKVGYKYNFLFNITYKSVTYYKTITIEGNELYEVDKYQNNTNYYVDIDKVKTNSIVINPTNSDIYLPNDVTFHLNPTNSQATADKNSFNLKYKIEENHTVGEISWSNLENTTGNNKIWTFEFKIKAPYSGKIFKILFNFFLMPMAISDNNNDLTDGTEADGSQYIALTARSSTIGVANKTFTVSSTIPGIKLVSALNGGTENKTDGSGRIYLKGKTELQNSGNVSYIISLSLNNFTLDTTYVILPGQHRTLPIDEKIYKMEEIQFGADTKYQIQGWSEDFISVLSKTDSEIETYIINAGLGSYKFGNYLEVNLSGQFLAWNADFKNALVWSKLNIDKLNFQDSNWIVWSNSTTKFYSGFESFKGVTSNSLKEIDLSGACFFASVKTLTGTNKKLTISDTKEWNAYMNYNWTSGTTEHVREYQTEYHSAYHTFDGCNFKNLKILNLGKANFFMPDFLDSIDGPWAINLSDTNIAHYYLTSGTTIKIFGASSTFLGATIGSDESFATFSFKETKFFSGYNDDNTISNFNVNSNYNRSGQKNYLNMEVTSGSRMFYGSTIYAQDLTFDDVKFYPWINVAPGTSGDNFIFGVSGANIGNEMFQTAKIHTSKICFTNCIFARDYSINKDNSVALSIKVLDHSFASSTLYGVSEITVDETNHFTIEDKSMFPVYGKSTLSLFDSAFANIDNKGKTQKINLECILNMRIRSGESTIKGISTIQIFQNTFENFVPNTECHISIGWNTNPSNIDYLHLSSLQLIFFDGAFANFGGTENYVKVYGEFDYYAAQLIVGTGKWNPGFVDVKSIDLSKMIFADYTFTSTVTYDNLFDGINTDRESSSGTYIYLPNLNTTSSQKFDRFKLGYYCFNWNRNDVFVFVGYSSRPIFMLEGDPAWQFYNYST